MKSSNYTIQGMEQQDFMNSISAQLFFRVVLFFIVLTGAVTYLFYFGA